MKDLTIYDQEEDWNVLLTLLPSGWQEKAKELGALRRCRNFSGPENLLRTLLIHLVDGCSLRETAVRATQGDLATISDVALLKRLKSSGEWFRWIAEQLMQEWVEHAPTEVFGEDMRARMVDGTTVSEPGATGTTWRIHYSTRLPTLQCDEVYITSPREGETLKRFHVSQGDLLIGDRGFAHRAGIHHVVKGGGDVLVRINLTNLPLVSANRRRVNILAKLRTLRINQCGDWPVNIDYQDELISGRLCAVKKSRAAAQKAREKVRKENGRKGHQVKLETLEAAGYTFAFSTLSTAALSAQSILEIYRGRWQIELVFKRLKSIMGLGHLKKTDVEGAKAWLHGKLMAAFLVEALISAGEKFFPWGYPLTQCEPEQSLPMERVVSDAPRA